VSERRNGILAVCPDIVALFTNTVSKQLSNFDSLLFWNTRDTVAKQCFVDMHASTNGSQWSNITKWTLAPAVCAAYGACGQGREKWGENLGTGG
jgi:hypothetical protein